MSLEKLKTDLRETLTKMGWDVVYTEGWSNRDGSMTMMVTVKPRCE